MKKVFLNTIYGIAWGCTVFVIMGIIDAASGKSNISSSNAKFIKNALSSMIIGVGFFLPSIVYSSKKLSMSLKKIIHLGIGMSVWIITSAVVGWLPNNVAPGAVFTAILLMLIICVVIYLAFYLYYRSEAKTMNQKLNSKKKE